MEAKIIDQENEKKKDPTKWHTKEPEAIYQELKTRIEGLSKEEAEERKLRYGLNKLPETKGDGWITIFLGQFQSSLIYVLIAADVIVFWLEEYIDAFIILFVLLFNATLGTIQEGRAQNTLSALKHFVQTRASVIRSDKEMVIQDFEVVPGDIIILHEGEKIPADARIIEANNLKTEEATLTGESTPVRKEAAVMTQETNSVAEQRNMVFKGTSIAVGYGKAIVVATGLETAIGQISKSISEIKSEIPLQKSLTEFSRVVVGITIILIALIFVIGLNDGIPVKEMFITAVSISVAAVPEGLPLVLTVVLATGVWRMAKRKVLVKKLQAVEALGQAQVIAVDKTGTITKNELVIQKVILGDEEIEIKGIGYEPKPEISSDNPGIQLAGKIAAMCANAKIIFSEEKKTYQVIGDPTEAAMIAFAAKMGINKDGMLERTPLINDWPFDYEKKYHRALFQEKDKKVMAITGAPEIILNISKQEWKKEGATPLTEERRKKLETIFIQLSEQGMRVIAFGYNEDVRESVVSDSLPPITFVGFYAMKDGLREGIREQVEEARKAGIKVVMITGDHKVAAQAIAREAGIYKEGSEMLTGDDLNNLSEKELKEKIGSVSIFARVTPDHKKKIIQVYKELGEVIAMTGDGVNDAPSLVAADLGIAMGKIGTEVTKEASDLVLMEDNFGDIIGAVEEGRGMRQGIKRTIIYLFSSNLGEIIVIAGALLLKNPLPLIAAQIIWMNVVTDTFFDISLALEPQGDELLDPKYAKPKKLFDKLMLQRMLVIAPIMSLGTLYLFLQYVDTASIEKARTVALSGLVIFQWFNAWNCRSEDKSIFQLKFFGNKFLISTLFIVVILHSLALYTPFLNNILGTVPLTLNELAPIIALGTTVIIGEEIRKLIARQGEKRKVAIA
ncbi:MAG: hypothetical protein COU08_01210 [Candidatus Harrisonbacteria bacterium CG10_big_fil_rev_8_21_14_0_10_42_17]|uniref:Cation-transporting P-type ATPase N-terminal domain-containing protein n=1 Tax=Candidatus Harrisonbacteria bacterium CG10_big_fil_rev_8_21_14_0_10_42_17 TaxID=1974584 RepID=A0A2M6WIH5_9BACT|nr:MAG: hypothetical protein COU08_01210 [Candidatus Harrisonbacteria bacterium CG10_big_fil_rev_8_21_14_0_10_42_17]